MQRESSSGGPSRGSTNIITGTSSHPDGDDDARHKAEAGLVRGAARSLGRVSRSPMVGRLPAPRTVVPRSVTTVPSAAPRPTGAVMPRRLPVQRVAKVSDRVSQGLDLYDLASASSAKESYISKVRSFASSTFICLRCFLPDVNMIGLWMILPELNVRALKTC